MRLYEISAEFKELKLLVEQGEFTAEQIADTLEALNVTFEQKLINCMQVLQQLKYEEKYLGEEIERIESLKKSCSNNIEKLTEYVASNMAATEKDKVDLGLWKLTLKKPSPQLGAIDESKIPDTFFIEVPATKKLDKRALLAAAKENPIEGVQIVDSKRALLIR